MEPAAERWRNQVSRRGAGNPAINNDEPPPPPTPEELELEREMEYFVEPEEAFTRDAGE